MSGILGSLFDFRSKEEKQRIYEAYSKRIFPYGDAQKEQVEKLLTDLFPKQDPKYVMMHYILIKEGMTGENPQDFDTAAKNVKHSPIRSTPELHVGIHAILDADLVVNEKLEYPTLEELRTIASNTLSNG